MLLLLIILQSLRVEVLKYFFCINLTYCLTTAWNIKANLSQTKYFLAIYFCIV